MKHIDCRGLTYLKTIRKIKEYFNSIGEGESIIIVENNLEKSNVIRFAMHKGYQVEQCYNDDEFLIHIEKRGCLDIETEEEIFSILIMSDKLGTGNNDVGKKLMKEYFEALNECNKLPKEIMLINEGVKLVQNDSEVLEDIKLLYKKGVMILINDTSLESYGLEDGITFGEITNMYHMVETMNNSKNLIKL